MKSSTSIITAVVVLVAIVIGVVFIPHWFEIDQMAGNSMAPTYHQYDHFILRKFGSTYRLGDVIIYSDVGGGYAPGRVVGVPGDAFTIASGTLTVRGTTYTYPQTWKLPDWAGSRTLEVGQYLVLDDAHDSPPQLLTRQAIIGAALFPRKVK